MKVTYIDLGLHKSAPELRMFTEICNKYGIEYDAFGVEADPDYIDGLKAVFQHDPKVRIYNFAVGGSDGVCRLYRSDFLDGEGNSIYASKNNVDVSNSVQVPMRRLSEFLKEVPLNDAVVLKWNIEGAEYPMMLDLVDTGAYKKINLFCGATPDMHKVGELKGLESSYLDLMHTVGIHPFLFHDHYNQEKKNAMYHHMKDRLLDLNRTFANRNKPLPSS